MELAAVLQLPSFSALGVLACLGGILAMDNTAFGQIWISLPLAAGLLTGFIFGDVLIGLAVALPLQIVLAGNLPIGQTFVGDHTSAITAGVAAGIMASASGGIPVAPGRPLPWDLLGWLLMGIGLLSVGGHWLIQFERRAHGLWMQEGHRTLRDGSLTRIERLHRRCLQATFLRGALTTVLFVLLLSRLWIPLFSSVPSLGKTAAGMLPVLLPALGVGNLIDRYGLRSGWPWLAVGSVAAIALSRGLV